MTNVGPIATCAEDRPQSPRTNLGHKTKELCSSLNTTPYNSASNKKKRFLFLRTYTLSIQLEFAIGEAILFLSLPCILSSSPPMASLSATSLSFKAPSIQSTRISQVLRKPSSFQSISFGGFQSSKSLRLQISCAAKPETVQKVSDIVKEQLALSADTALTAESKFSALGADSLDTVEIVMALEEKFNISVEESDAQNITTIQEAADLIEDLVQKKPAA